MCAASPPLTNAFSATSPDEEYIFIGLLCARTCKISAMPERYLEFWSAREEVHRIWMSVYTPQRGEQSAERLTCGRPQTAGRSHSRTGPEISQVSDQIGNGAGHPEPAVQPRAMHLCAGFGELHSRSAHAREALCVWRRSGLFGMRLRHQLRTALDHERKGRTNRSAAFAGCLVSHRRSSGKAEKSESARSVPVAARTHACRVPTREHAVL